MMHPIAAFSLQNRNWQQTEAPQEERSFCRKACSSKQMKWQKTSPEEGKNFVGCVDLLKEEGARKKEKEHEDRGSVDRMPQLWLHGGATAAEWSYCKREQLLFFFLLTGTLPLYFIISFCIQYLYVNLGHRVPE
jgi:hypothetical protein